MTGKSPGSFLAGKRSHCSHCPTWDVVTALVELGCLSRPALAGAHAEMIVLHDKQHRQRPDCRQVVRLQKDAVAWGQYLKKPEDLPCAPNN